MSLNTGYRASRVDYLGTHGVAFDRAKAGPSPEGVRVDLEGARTVLRRALTLPTFVQGNIGSCEWQAASAALAILDPSGIIPSRRAGYVESLFRDGAVGGDGRLMDRGTTAETVHAILREVGVCSEQEWPYTDDAETWDTRPSIAALQSGFRHRIDATHRIASGDIGADVRVSIDAGRPVQIGGPITQAYIDAFDVSHDELVVDDLWQSIGGHAQLVVGYWRRDGQWLYLVRNSWGDGGLRELPGHAWYTTNALGMQDELFAFYRAK